jgi:hypothetical protein
MRFAAAMFTLCALALTGDEIPRHVLDLARIKRRMTDELNRLPNYTCLETIDRYSAVKGGKMKPFDRIRIQVAIVDGKELYSWPGATRFDDRSLADMVNNGFISDGDFAAMARNVFVNRTAIITFAGRETRDGREVLRYNFEISHMRSGWHVRLRNASGIVGAKGWFDVDTATLDLVRFSFAAQDLPPFSTDKSLEETAEYGRVPLGGSEILIPLAVDLHSEAINSDSRWNHTTFTACRQYTAESSISFAEENAAIIPATAIAAKEEVQALPSGLEIPLKLDTPIDSAHAAVGDEILAIVSKNVRMGHETILPSGAVVKGVIRRLDRHRGSRPYFEVGIELTEAAYSRHRAIVYGKLEELSAFRGMHRNVVGFTTLVDPPPGPGVGYFYVEGDAFVIPKGQALTWLTQPLPHPVAELVINCWTCISCSRWACWPCCLSPLR